MWREMVCLSARQMDTTNPLTATNAVRQRRKRSNATGKIGTAREQVGANKPLQNNFNFEILVLDIALEFESGFLADVLHRVILLEDLRGDTIELFAAPDLDKTLEQ